MFVDSGEKLVEECERRKLSIAEYTIEEEILKSEKSYEFVFSRMKKSLEVMKTSAQYGTNNKVKSMSGLIGGDGFKLNSYSKEENTITGSIMVKVMARAIGTSEVNASMGKIVAAPTAGSCGILPAVILTVGEKFNKSDDELTKALFTASGIGMLIAKNATLSGAEGGCQAECGSAAAMAAGAVVEMMGGTPKMALDAAAIVIKNVLGLVCDPVAGLVEVPCSKRNASGAVNAITTADMVLAGVASIIPFDDTITAMYRVGKQLPCELRETALGGLAVTKKGQELKNKIMK
ncbi:L-serine ammonia-lyase, iron-sulfur-dependent, subunit alpha [Clostridium felsineum]|uniref:L-serine dehydratase n=1 Tax=Clostridium felsineum TaxID=36839 RepID=A0A1S8LUX4_9CLOT|nr:L-serine ammonia-lyase, iron-sulfur-dependent, subunit alpha [Clostridium felsineum]URZ01755.1 L-serine dehydratase, alpha chain [Clostridium felsineum]URZ05387.1 L-serine dehydratase, alpha chain [Clostridium felsineum]URZ10428.1 L-serine dehydratase, alpha chain [Clostridium felsineum]URZ17643.1 L-serine dehydratase, alpha chain [Clostridium felsineum DSM 794]